MTDEDKVVAEAESILTQYQEELVRSQIAEHQQSMPFLSEAAKTMVLANHGEYDPKNSIHLFLIQEDKDVPLDQVANPLGIDAPADERMVGAVRHLKGFHDSSVATAALRDSRASIAFCEGMADSQFATFLALNDSVFALYAARKLTVSKRAGNGEFVSHTADLTGGKDQPNEFFAKCGLTDKDIMPITAMMYFVESGWLMKQEMPEVYNLMVRRIRDMVEGEDGES